MKKSMASPTNQQSNSRIIAEITKLRKQVAFHSILYYRCDHSLWSDERYDVACKKLASLQRVYPTESREAKHFEAFEDFTGSTGYHICYHKDFTHYPSMARNILALEIM